MSQRKAIWACRGCQTKRFRWTRYEGRHRRRRKRRYGGSRGTGRRRRGGNSLCSRRDDACVCDLPVPHLYGRSQTREDARYGDAACAGWRRRKGVGCSSGSRRWFWIGRARSADRARLEIPPGSRCQSARAPGLGYNRSSFSPFLSAQESDLGLRIQGMGGRARVASVVWALGYSAEDDHWRWRAGPIGSA